MSKPSTLTEVNLAKRLDECKENEHFKGSEELAAMQTKVEQAWEADKLAKRQARTPEVAVHSVSTALQRQKATQAKTQAKLVELEAAARAAVEAVEEARQKVVKQQAEIDKLQEDHEAELARLVKTSDPVTHHQKSVRAAFKALPLWKCCSSAPPNTAGNASTGLSSMLAAAAPTPQATDACNDDIDMLPDKAISAEAVAWAFERSQEGLPEDEREAKKQKFVEFVEEERRV